MYVPAWPSIDPRLLAQPTVEQDLPFPLNRQNAHYFYLARNGIYQLFIKLALKPDEIVLAPDYHHGNEIYAMQAAGVNIRFYPVRRNLEIDINAVASLCNSHTRVLYVTHYLGWPQPMHAIRDLCRDKGLLLVEDCALAFLSSSPDAALGSTGDYAVFCLYKTLPVPNGGVLVSNIAGGLDLPAWTPRKPAGLSVAGRSIELVLQWFRSHHEKTGAALFAIKRSVGSALTAARLERTPVGDNGFHIGDADLAISPFSRSLMERLNYTEIRKRRRHNFKFLLHALEGYTRPVRADLEEGVCPLAFPLLVRDKHVAAQQLWDRHIGATEFWNEGDPAADINGSDAEFLRRHVLEIPIHQEINDSQLAYIAEQIRELNLGTLDL